MMISCFALPSFNSETERLFGHHRKTLDAIEGGFGGRRERNSGISSLRYFMQIL